MINEARVLRTVSFSTGMFGGGGLIAGSERPVKGGKSGRTLTGQTLQRLAYRVRYRTAVYREVWEVWRRAQAAMQELQVGGHQISHSVRSIR